VPRAARNALEIPGVAKGYGVFLTDLMYWVAACRRAEKAPPNPGVVLGGHSEDRASQGEEFITRRFNPGMALKTVIELSGKWHDAVASNMTGPSYEFPAAWYDAAKIGGYEIVPILSGGDLYREGYAMHHCVGTYGDRIRRGEVYVFSVRQHEARVATLELVRHGERVSQGLLRGPSNSRVSKGIEVVVRRWLRAQKEPRLPKLLVGA
jgi:hypothetical protein